MNLAAIDIGSNAARLLVTKVNNSLKTKEPLFSKLALVRVPLRLGFDVFDSGYISEGKREKLLTTIQAYKLLLEVYNVSNWKACATSAMREAKNKDEIVQYISLKTGIDIEIISGDKEATLIYENHIAENLNTSASYIYLDVGGGSTECTFFSKGKIISQQSFDIGTIRILKKKVKKILWNKMKDYLKKNTKEFSNIKFIGSGGNINKVFSLSKVKENRPVDLKTLKYFYEDLSPLTVTERMRKYKLKEDRADVIIPALQIYLQCMKWTKATEIFIPKIGLSDGIIHNLYNDRINV